MKLAAVFYLIPLISISCSKGQPIPARKIPLDQKNLPDLTPSGTSGSSDDDINSVASEDTLIRKYLDANAEKAPSQGSTEPFDSGNTESYEPPEWEEEELRMEFTSFTKEEAQMHLLAEELENFQYALSSGKGCTSYPSWLQAVPQFSLPPVARNSTNFYSLQFRKNNGAVSPCFDINFIHDDIPPEGSIRFSHSDAITNKPEATLMISFNNDAEKMQLYSSADCGEESALGNLSLVQPTVGVSLTTTGINYFSVKLLDAAVNPSLCYAESTIFDDVFSEKNNPVIINSGENITNGEFVALSVSSQEASEISVTTDPECPEDANWVSFESEIIRKSSLWPLAV